jgi:putative ABC transport system permease protein
LSSAASTFAPSRPLRCSAAISIRQTTSRAHPPGLPAVFSEQYWHNVLHGDPHVVGRKLLANKVPFTIVGVMPKRFLGTDHTQHPQIFLPLASEPLIDAPYNNTAGGYHSWWLTTMGLSKPDITLEQANASLASVTRSVLSGKDDDAEGAAEWLKDARAHHFRYAAESGSSGFTYLRQLYRQPLQAVLALCCGMLLLACLNLASLLFARAATRQHELATRLAVGASRRRLLQQLLLESLLLAITGSIAGIAAAPFVARSLAVLLLGKDPSIYLDTSLDWRVLAAAACACVLATPACTPRDEASARSSRPRPPHAWVHISGCSPPRSRSRWCWSSAPA